MEYKGVIREITELKWHEYKPLDIIEVSRCAAIEFAQSLRLALTVHPSDLELKEMKAGEIETTNLIFDDSPAEARDHWQFLDYFLSKLRPGGLPPDNIINSFRRYCDLINKMTPAQRAMTVFSRERELAAIFEKIEAAHDWEKIGLGFYKYFLKRHIELDTSGGGHGDLTSKHELDSEILLSFYKTRLTFYNVLKSTDGQ